MSLINFCLQLFAEDSGGASEGASGQVAAAGAASTQQDTTLGNVSEEGTGAAQGAAVEAPAAVASERIPYEKMRDQYKDEISAEIQAAIKDRFKSASNEKASLKALRPLIERTARRYGVEATDLKGIAAAVKADQQYYEDLALKNGTTAEVERQLEESTLEARNAKEELEARKAEEQKDKYYRQIGEQVSAAKAKYSDFNLSEEMTNPTFAAMASAGFPILNCYESVHHDELMQRAMATSVQAAAAKTANNIRAGAGRPSENGATAGAAAKVEHDVASMSLEEINQLMRAAQRGERVTI